MIRHRRAWLVLIAAQLQIAAAAAQDVPMPAPVPEGPTPSATGFDAEDYARRLVGEAEGFAAAGEWAKALGYLRYTKTMLAATTYAKEHAAEIAEAYGRAEDEVASATFKEAVALGEKAPAKAREKLAALRTQHGGSRFFAEKREAILALETRVRTALWEGRRGFRGEPLLPAEGVVRLTYRFQRVEELADLETAAPKAAPRIEGGRLAATRADGLLRHRLAVPAGATFSADIEARGYGKLTLILDGEGAEAAPGGLALEVETTAKALKLALRRGDERDPHQAEEARPAGVSPATPFTLHVERRGGRVVAASGGARVEAAASAPGAMRLGLAFPSGKVELTSLAIEGPLPPARPAAPGEEGPEKAPLPRRVWIPLLADGLDGWRTIGRWSIDGDVIKSDAEYGNAVSRELEGRSLDHYTFTVDLRLVPDDSAKARAKPLVDVVGQDFTLTFPVGGRRVTWVFGSREMRLESGEVFRHGGALPAGAWQTIVVKVGPQGLEAFVGSQAIFNVPLAKLGWPDQLYRTDGLGFSTSGLGTRRVELRAPKIRLE